MRKLRSRYIPVLRSVMCYRLVIITNNTSQEEKKSPCLRSSLKWNTRVIVVEVMDLDDFFPPPLTYCWVYIDDSGSNSEQSVHQCHMPLVESVQGTKHSMRWWHGFHNYSFWQLCQIFLTDSLFYRWGSEADKN